MAPTVTLLDSQIDTVNDNNIASGSISPSANVLLVAKIYFFDSGNNGFTGVSDTLSGGSLTWTQRAAYVSNLSSYAGCAIYTAQAGATPGTGVVTATFTTTGPRKVIFIEEVATHDADAPVTQGKTNYGNANTLTITFDSAPASDSLILAAVVSAMASGGNIGPGSGFSELAEVNTAAGVADISGESMYDADNADTTVDWTSLGTTNNVGAAIEIKAAAGAGGYTLDADGGSYTLSGTAAGLLADRMLPAGSGAYLLTGLDVTLLYSGATTPTPAARIYVIHAENRVYLIAVEDRRYAVPA